ncbi:hypothetical protein [Acidaminobacterium chupaoyuni]
MTAKKWRGYRRFSNFGACAAWQRVRAPNDLLKPGKTGGLPAAAEAAGKKKKEKLQKKTPYYIIYRRRGGKTRPRPKKTKKLLKKSRKTLDTLPAIRYSIEAPIGELCPKA